jgi:hypothetical protein
VEIDEHTVWVDTECMSCGVWPLTLVKAKEQNATLVECPNCLIRFSTIGVNPLDEEEFLELVKCERCKILCWFGIEGALNTNPYIADGDPALCSRCWNYG